MEQAGSVFELSFKKDWIYRQTPLVAVNAYCLLGNHYHLLLTQLTDGGISEYMKRLGGGYTSYFNERYDRSGALFQGKYKRVQCTTNEQLLYLAAYVNLNHKAHARKEYFLSSYSVYAGERTESFVATDIILGQYKDRMGFVKSAAALVDEIARKRRVDKEYDRLNLLE